MDVVIATRNPDKVREIAQILEGRAGRILTMDDIDDLPEVEEDGLTFEENARKKALAVARFTGRVAMADDSGLVVDVLHGRPGVHSARYAGPDATPEKNNRKLLEELEGVPLKKRTARFVCVIAIATPSGKVFVAEGRCEGLIAREPRGRTGFGYDPLFLVPDEGKTFAELGPEVKNRISHRALALERAVRLLEELGASEKA